jgi:hypothetical protein
MGMSGLGTWLHPLKVDASAKGFYTRGTPIADRHNTASNNPISSGPTFSVDSAGHQMPSRFGTIAVPSILQCGTTGPTAVRDVAYPYVDPDRRCGT